MAKQDINMTADEELDDAGSELRVYELGFHLDPELPTEQVKKSYQAIQEFVTLQGSLVAESEPQKIQLAYTISRQETSGRRDFESAYFSWIVYESTAANHAEILNMAANEKRIIRFIDLITTKDAARHSVEMREISLKATEHKDDLEETAAAELDVALENAVV